MGKFYDHVPPRLHGFIERAHVFFVATAPLEGGSVNVSPKATHSGDGHARLFELIGKNRARYLDLTGSGNETVSHIMQPGNGRLTIMFVNIEAGAPNIVRLYGKATVRERGSVEAGAFAAQWYGGGDGGNDIGDDARGAAAAEHADIPIGGRAIIDLAIHTCSTSCGYSIPVFEYRHRRTILDDVFVRADKTGVDAFAKRVGKPVPDGMLLPPPQPADSDGAGGTGDSDATSAVAAARPLSTALEAYWALNNNLSIDGLPGFSSVRSMRDASEQAALAAKKDMHDQLAPPPPTLPPAYYDQRGTRQTSSSSKGNAEGALAGTLTQAFVMGPTLLAIAFAAGCVLTTALLLAARTQGWAV